MVGFTASRWLVAVVGFGFAGAVSAAPPPDLDRYAGRVMQTFETPGMVVAIAERGKPSIVRTYGVKRLGESAKVDEHSLFAIGSTTKAFTSAVLAMLVDEGKLTWETKVSDVLPGFKMYDPYASAEMTVRDLLVHRSGLGLGAGDLLFFPTTTLSSADIVHRLRYIKPATSFRSGYAYDNLLYVAAGQVIEAVTKMSWHDAIRQRILTPLQMKDTSTSSALKDGTNRAWPHIRTSEVARGIGPMAALDKPMTLDNSAAAGAINASGADLTRWLELQLGRGLDPRTNTRLFSETQSKEMWTGVTLMPTPTTLPKGMELAKPNFRAYALGWVASDYRGEPILAHAGGVPGFVTMFIVMPQRNVAFAILTNSEEMGTLASMQNRLLDHYLGLKSPDWIAALDASNKEKITQAREALAEKPATNEPVKGPSLAIAKYAGRYRDAWYGPVSIESAGEALRIRFENTPTMIGTLEHVRYDTFRARWEDRGIEDAYVTFALTPEGSIERLTMKAVSPLADFSFDYQDLWFTPER
ncbi:serine hydrolase [Steroidobacter sp.]|uniref:serine hydrolase n=1 Tax=Steroidobacter sp. TaxID=1978227 RepID=UPI001A435000|nr:serine hydrolase [Steroidobacter sp.]MBL8269423.1 serine hydrolase [Steroidobacter sp.]